MVSACRHSRAPLVKIQPCSQTLSLLTPLAIGKKTLVVAGHMTTQNLGGKKNLLGGRGDRVF